MLEVIHKTKERNVTDEGCRRFKGSQRSEETGKVMRVKAAVCRRRGERRRFKGWWITPEEPSSSAIQYLPRAEWVVEPNGVALKTSCKKKGLSKWTASLLIIEDSLRKPWQSYHRDERRLSTKPRLNSFVVDFFWFSVGYESRKYIRSRIFPQFFIGAFKVHSTKTDKLMTGLQCKGTKWHDARTPQVLSISGQVQTDRSVPHPVSLRL